jgi:hypothetical protein
MTKTSKIIMGLAMAATALTSLSSMAMAENQHEVLLSYTNLDLTIGGVGNFDGDAATLSSRGIYDNGLRYNLEITDADIDTLGSTTFGELDVRYMFDTYGVAVTYSDSNNGDSMFGVGGAVEYMTDDMEAYALLTADTDEFMDDFRLVLSGRYDVVDNFMVLAEYNHNILDAEDDVQTIEFGARYTLVNDAFVEARYGTSVDSSNIDLDVYSVGLGFNF